MFLFNRDDSHGGYTPSQEDSHPSSKRMRDYQTEAYEGVFREFDAGKQTTLVVLPTGCGKAQPVDCMLLTPNGWMPMGFAKVGDEVIGSDGLPHRITGVFPQGRKIVYRVKFSDGTSTRCCREHLWSVQTKSQKHDGAGFKTVTLEDLFGDIKDATGANKWFVPVVSPVQFPKREVPIDPYVLGVLLGDGGLKYHAIFSSADSFIVEQMAARIGDASIKHETGYDYAIRFGTKGRYGCKGAPFTRALRQLGIWGKGAEAKFIPDIYLFNDVETRLAVLRGLMDLDYVNNSRHKPVSVVDALGAVLRGLMDTDGHVRPKEAHAEFSTVSWRLAQDVCELVRSLGGCTKIRFKPPGRYTHKGEARTGRPSYRVTVTLNGINPFLLPRKAELVKLQKKQGQTKAIVAIDRLSGADCQCISVDAPDQLYVTDDYILTHNTVLFSKVATSWPNGNVLVLAHRVELLDQAADKLACDLGYRPPIEQGQRGLEADMIWQGGNTIIGSVQTMRNMKRMGKYRETPFGLVIVDEAHHAVSASYRKIIDQCLEFNPQCKVMGVTATPNRADNAALGIVFESVAYGMELQEAIEKGWLVDIRQEYIQIEDVDFSGITLTRNKFGEVDFRREELETILTEEKALHAMAKPLLDRSANGEQCLVFNAGVAHAHLMAAVLNRYKDQSAAAVDGKTDPVKRQEIVRDFHAGRIQYLCNFGVFTEGFDCPSTTCVVMARPTKSVGLYLQMLGRGTRPLPGVVDGPETPELRRAAIAGSAKTHMVSLDYVNNSRHKPVSVVDALGGDYDAQVRELAEDRIREKKAKGTVRDELEKAKADIALYGEEAKRKAIVAQEVKYRSHQVDVFGRGATPVGQSVDVPRGGASDGQIGLLVSFGVPYKTAAGYSKRQASGVISAYKERTCTTKQANILSRFGYSAVPFDQAKKIIDRIAANGWRRPA